MCCDQCFIAAQEKEEGFHQPGPGQRLGLLPRPGCNQRAGTRGQEEEVLVESYLTQFCLFITQVGFGLFSPGRLSFSQSGLREG